MLSELDRAAGETGDRILNTVFFGGGTPSLMSPDLVEAILDRARTNWRWANDLEVTLEANPSTVEAGRFAAFRDAGVNRVSIGVQALDDVALRQLGRRHSMSEALAAIDIAQGLFPRFSFDLIYARQGQTLEAWQKELRQALAQGPRHLSLYQLTIEEGTVFHERHRRGQLRGLPDEDLSADMYLATQEICEAFGLPAYEVSNHAAAGEESRHNMTYWLGGDYVGIGPGAHGRLTLGGQRIATECHRSPGDWLNAVRQVGHGEIPRATLSREDHGLEFLMMGLRLAGGLRLADLEAALGRRLSPASLADLEADGLIRWEGGRLCATREGILVLNTLVAAISQRFEM